MCNCGGKSRNQPILGVQAFSLPKGFEDAIEVEVAPALIGKTIVLKARLANLLRVKRQFVFTEARTLVLPQVLEYLMTIPEYNVHLTVPDEFIDGDDDEQAQAQITDTAKVEVDGVTVGHVVVSDDLTVLDGVGDATAKVLQEGGYSDLASIANALPHDIVAVFEKVQKKPPNVFSLIEQAQALLVGQPVGE